MAKKKLELSQALLAFLCSSILKLLCLWQKPKHMYSWGPAICDVRSPPGDCEVLFKTQNSGPHFLIQEVRGRAQECAFFVLYCSWVTTMLLTFEGPDFENHCFSEWELIYCYLQS